MNNCSTSAYKCCWMLDIYENSISCICVVNKPVSVIFLCTICFLLNYLKSEHWSFSLIRITKKHMSHLLRIKCHLMNIVNPWKMMAHGLDIWNYKLLLLLLIVTYVYTKYITFPHLYVLFPSYNYKISIGIFSYPLKLKNRIALLCQ